MWISGETHAGSSLLKASNGCLKISKYPGSEMHNAKKTMDKITKMIRPKEMEFISKRTGYKRLVTVHDINVTFWANHDSASMPQAYLGKEIDWVKVTSKTVPEVLAGMKEENKRLSELKEATRAKSGPPTPSPPPPAPPETSDFAA